MQTINYLNLSNGIEFKDDLAAFRLVRIQSTALEQKRWAFILDDLPYQFLIDLGLGRFVQVWDTGHGGESRALWYGIPWIRFVLELRWLKRNNNPMVKTHHVGKQFGNYYRSLPATTLFRLDYVWKMTGQAERVRLVGKYDQTLRDGDYGYHRKLLLEAADAGLV